MVSNLAGCLFLLSLLLILVFLAWSLGVQQQRHLLHNLYIALMLTYAVWAIALLAIWITPPSQLPLIQALDAIAHLGTGVSSFYLMIAIVFVRGYERLPRYFLLQCMKVKSESEVAQSCPTPSYPMDCSPPGSSIYMTEQSYYWEYTLRKPEF